jgi:hypothetical protein
VEEIKGKLRAGEEGVCISTKENKGMNYFSRKFAGGLDDDPLGVGREGVLEMK